MVYVGVVHIVRLLKEQLALVLIISKIIPELVIIFLEVAHFFLEFSLALLTSESYKLHLL